MIENLIQSRYGSQSQSERPGGRQVTPDGRPAAPNTVIPANANIPAPQNPSVGFATHVIAPDLLLAAQESRSARETRADDAVQANTQYARQDRADEAETASEANQETLHRGRQAYLAAGAADGREFGQATADSTQLYGDGLNIIV